MRIVVLLGVVVCLALLVAERRVAACVIASHGAYEHVAEGLFVSPDLDRVPRAGAVERLSTARGRVAELLGPLEAEPVVLVTPSQGEAAWLGLAPEVPGAAYSVPWGTYIVVSPKGQNVDVLAHELVHAELATRLGYLDYALTLPTWFDEGLAMQVDDRDEEIAQAIREGRALPPVESLQSIRDFSSGEVALNYAASQVEVARWLAEDGHPGAAAFVRELGRSGDFETLYGRR